MKSLVAFVVSLIILMISVSGQANTEQMDLNRNLFKSAVDLDFEKFKEYLFAGANPNVATEAQWYASAAACEVTKPGKDLFLDLIVETVEKEEYLAGAGIDKTPVGCAIRYKNLEAFKRFISMGIDISAVVNPDVPERSQRTLLDVAFIQNRMDIVLFIIERSEPNEKQLSAIVQSLESFGGFEGSSSVQHYVNMAKWLRDHGIEVNLAPPAPDPRTIVR